MAAIYNSNKKINVVVCENIANGVNQIISLSKRLVISKEIQNGNPLGTDVSSRLVLIFFFSWVVN